MDFKAVSAYMIQRMERDLRENLTYHSIEHTLDVLEATRRFSDSENVDALHKTLLETTALFHDAGMMVRYKEHESASAEIAKEVLPQFGYTPREIAQIAELIMVTKLPQRPLNHLEQIICDADLDYLGRDDFFIHSFKLKLEWQHNSCKETTLLEWFRIQVNFLTEHQYFTQSARILRNDKKMEHLRDIKLFIEQR